MKALAAVLGTAIATAALAQAPFKSALPQAACDDCGTVTRVQSVSKELAQQPIDEGEPSGLVATIPLGGGSMRAGSSSRVGKEAPNVSTQWEAVVRLDDGRYQILRLNEKPAFGQGDRVRVRVGRLERPPGG